MSRVFLLDASETHTSGDFNLKDLPSSSGRLDIVCRCAIACLLDQERIRNDTVFLALLEGEPNPPLCLRFDGSLLRKFPFSETGVAALLKSVLGEFENRKTEYRVPYWDGVSIKKESFAGLINAELMSGRIFYLHERGEDIRTVDLNPKEKTSFVLGSYKGLDPIKEKSLEQLGAERLSVGHLSYLSSQVITLVHDELDRRMARTTVNV